MQKVELRVTEIGDFGNFALRSCFIDCRVDRRATQNDVINQNIYKLFAFVETINKIESTTLWNPS